MAHLELLRSDNKTLMAELEKMSKNPEYKSKFAPQSLITIEDTKNKRITNEQEQPLQKEKSTKSISNYYNR